MIDYAITSATGWIMMILLVAIIAYPFLLRAGILGPIQPFLKRMRVHYWMGYSLGAALLLHIWFSMSGGTALVVNAVGLYLATVAMFLVWHFWFMVGLVAFILAHVALNSALVQTLLAI